MKQNIDKGRIDMSNMLVQYKSSDILELFSSISAAIEIQLEGAK